MKMKIKLEKCERLNFGHLYVCLGIALIWLSGSVLRSECNTLYWPSRCIRAAFHLFSHRWWLLVLPSFHLWSSHRFRFVKIKFLLFLGVIQLDWTIFPATWLTGLTVMWKFYFKQVNRPKQVRVNFHCLLITRSFVDLNRFNVKWDFL